MFNSIENRIIESLYLVRPYLAEDDGDIEFVNYDERSSVVELRFLGRCKTCPLQLMTLRGGIEKIILRKVPEVRRIEAVK